MVGHLPVWLVVKLAIHRQNVLEFVFPVWRYSDFVPEENAAGPCSNVVSPAESLTQMPQIIRYVQI